MKKSSAMLLTGVLIMGLVTNVSAQDSLPMVTVIGYNYKYLKSVHDTSAAQPVNFLQHRAASFDVKNSGYYEDDYDEYSINFFIPSGQILATYDKDGKIIRTAEKFKDLSLPSAVRNAVSTRFPKWTVSKDVYLVSYNPNATNPSKLYKLLLENGNKRLRVKANEKGEFIE